MKLNKNKIIALILYLLPVIFFVVSYFGITVSGEDIYQGANTTPNPLGDAMNAFRFNGRISDMYAWAVINYFNYQFCFGADTIFRIVDVFMAFMVIYLLTTIVLGKKPSLQVKDANVFNFIFLIIISTSLSYVLYAGFSLIHNYLLIVLIPLIFFTLFIKYSHQEENRRPILLAISMTAVGVIFGLSSNLLPLAAVMTIVILFMIDKNRKRPKTWQISALLGIIAGICISYIVGPGVSNYANGGYATNYDYFAITETFSHIGNLIHHEIHNFGHVLLPITIIGVILFATIKLSKKHIQLSREEKKISIFSGVLGFCYLLTLSQIAAPIRLLFPAYICGVVILAIFAKHFFENCRKSRIINAILIMATCAINLVHLYLVCDYSSRMSIILNSIKASEEDTLCVEDYKVRTDIFLNQEDMLTGWVMPVKIYDKTITFCNK